MKMAKLTLITALAIGLGTQARAYYDDQTVVYGDENYVPVVTPVAEGTRGVLEGTGQVVKGAGEIVTLNPGQGVEDIAEGTGEAVKSAIMTPFNILSGN